MNVLITGSSSGIGHAAARNFILRGHSVVGLDILPPPSELMSSPQYVHYTCNVADYDSLPTLDDIDIVINNAGMQNTDRDIAVNLQGTINCTKKYVLDNPCICSVLNQCDAAVHTGAHLGEYLASKGGVLAYTKWTAKQIAERGAVCNSLSCGGVMTDSNDVVISNPELWRDVMELTPLKKWASEDQIAEWIYFLTVVNNSASGQDFVVDNLESLNGKFIWN